MAFWHFPGFSQTYRDKKQAWDNQAYSLFFVCNFSLHLLAILFSAHCLCCLTFIAFMALFSSGGKHTENGYSSMFTLLKKAWSENKNHVFLYAMSTAVWEMLWAMFWWETVGLGFHGDVTSIYPLSIPTYY